MSSDGKRNERKPVDPMEDIAARAIQEAMERGDFDNLPGKGKPLHLDPGEMTDPVGFAHKVRKNAGLIAPWSLLDEEIARELHRAEAEILAAYRRHKAALRNARSDVDAAQRAWNSALQTLRIRIDELNSKILKFNLTIPTQLPHLHKPKLCVEDTLRRLQIAGPNISQK